MKRCSLTTCFFLYQKGLCYEVSAAIIDCEAAHFLQGWMGSVTSEGFLRMKGFRMLAFRCSHQRTARSGDEMDCMTFCCSDTGVSGVTVVLLYERQTFLEAIEYKSDVYTGKLSFTVPPHIRTEKTPPYPF